VTGQAAWNKGLTKETDIRVAKASVSMMQIKKSPEWCRHISESKKGKPNPKHSAWLKLHSLGRDNPFFGKHHTDATKEKISNTNRGNTSRKGKRQPQTTGGNNPAKRPEVRAKISQRVSETHWDTSFEKNPNWQGGISFLPYKPYKHLRGIINTLDGEHCALCETTSHLGIHHTDYDKKNNGLSNLCILCNRCNSLVNKDRGFWKQNLGGLVIIRRRIIVE